MSLSQEYVFLRVQERRHLIYPLPSYPVLTVHLTNQAGVHFSVLSLFAPTHMLLKKVFVFCLVSHSDVHDIMHFVA